MEVLDYTMRRQFSREPDTLTEDRIIDRQAQAYQS